MKQKSTLKKITGSREFLLAVILILLFAIITAISPSFLKPKSLMDMLKNNAVTMVMALGMLCVMLVGGIDISIMSTLALSGMSIGMLLKYGQITSTILAFVIALAIGLACGFLVGLVISRASVPPIIATMGFMYVFRALGYLVSNNGEWAGAAALGSFKNFATSSVLGINAVVWVIILCYVVFFFFMKWTRTGRKIYAVGSNPSAAEVSGINVKNIKLSGLYDHGCACRSFGGALQVSVYASAMPDMQQGGENGCYCSLCNRRCKYERWKRYCSGRSFRILDPGHHCESTSAGWHRCFVAEYHQRCTDPCGSNGERDSAAYC